MPSNFLENGQKYLKRARYYEIATGIVIVAIIVIVAYLII